ncbi:MAG: trypsin-like peptidase domain-containing protein [Solirubrobacterales bacterium]
MQVQTAHEQLLFNTVRIELPGMSSGTGFFVTARGEEIADPSKGGDMVFLVTNKHVIEGHQGSIHVHMIRGNEANSGPELGQQVSFDMRVASPDAWTMHPDPDVDVAVAPFGQELQIAERAGQRPFLRAIRPDQMLSDQVVEQLDAVEEVTFIGYPRALYDMVNLTPLVRRGITSTPVALDWGGKPVFLIDAAVFPGSSGSPVYIADRGGWTDRSGNVTLGQSRLYLLGVVGAAYEASMFGELEEIVEETRRESGQQGVRINHSLNLGIVYKAAAIMDCVDIILERNGARRISPAPAEDQRQESGDQAQAA